MYYRGRGKDIKYAIICGIILGLIVRLILDYVKH
jgi:hypothetical protein